MAHRYQPTKNVQSAFVLVLVALLVAAVNIPTRAVSTNSAVFSEFFDDAEGPIGCTVTEAGFPWSFYQSSSASSVTSSGLYLLPALADLLVALAIFALAAGWVHCRYWHPRQPVLRSIGKRVSGVAFASILVALVLGLASATTAIRYHNEDRALAELSPNAETIQGYVINRRWSQRLPLRLQTPWQHVLSVHVNGFDHETLANISRLPFVATLQLNRGELDDRGVDELAKLRLLRSLELRNVNLDNLSASGVAKLSNLKSLKLSSVDVTPPVAGAITSLPNLSELRVHSSAESVAALGNQISGTKISALELFATRPTPAKANQAAQPTKPTQSTKLAITINEASNLTSLEVCGQRGAAIQLTLQNLPQLQALGLSNTNIFDLTVQQLPQLRAVGVFGQELSYLEGDYYESAFPLFNRLNVVDCAVLSELCVHSRFIETLDIENAPRLRSLMIARWPIQFVMNRGHEQVIDESDRIRFSRIVPQLSKITSLQKLSLKSIDLTGVDLAPLESLQRLTSIDLSESTVDAAQVLGLLSLKKLDSLNLERTGTTALTVDALLCGSNRWKQLIAGVPRYENLVIADQPFLTDFFGPELIRATSVAIINAPKLSGDLQITGRELRSLHVENAPKLRSIIVGGELPQRSVVQGVDQLEVFEAAGAAVNDTILASVCESSQLRRLVIDGCSASRTGLSQISSKRTLSSVHVANSAVDDELVIQWSALPQLRDIVLDGTAITRKSIAVLAQAPNLQRLSISYTRLTPEDLRPLETATTLMRLDVAGVGILPETLAQIAESRFLSQLDLSGVPVTNELFQVLLSREMRKLAVLMINDSGLTDTQALALTEMHENLVINAPRGEFSRSVLTSLEQGGRLLVGPLFASRMFFRSDAERLVQELPYATSSTIERTRLIRVLDREARVPRSSN